MSQKLLRYLEPLVDWKVLSLDHLTKENNYAVSKKRISKITIKAERLGITGSFVHFFSCRKCVYLTETGRKILATGNSSFAPDEELFEGVIISEVIYRLNQLINLDCFKFKIYNCSLDEHLNNPGAYFSHLGCNYYLNFIFRIGTKSRFKRRIMHQLESLEDCELIFLFARQNHLEVFEKSLPSKKNLRERVQLFYLPSIFSDNVDICESSELYKYLIKNKTKPWRQLGDSVLTQCLDTS